MNTREALFLFITFVLCTFYAFVGGPGGKKLDVIFFGGIFFIFSILEIKHIWWSSVLAVILGCSFWFFAQGTTLFMWICLNYGASFFISASILEKISFPGLNTRLFYSFPILVGILFSLGSIRIWKKCGLKKMKAIFTTSFSSLTFLIWGLFVTKNEGALFQFIIILYAMVLFLAGYLSQNKERRVEIV